MTYEGCQHYRHLSTEAHKWYTRVPQDDEGLMAALSAQSLPGWNHVVSTVSAVLNFLIAEFLNNIPTYSIYSVSEPPSSSNLCRILSDRGSFINQIRTTQPASPKLCERKEKQGEAGGAATIPAWKGLREKGWGRGPYCNANVIPLSAVCCRKFN